MSFSPFSAEILLVCAVVTGQADSSPGKAASLLQGGGYRARVRILLKTNPPAVAEAIDVRNWYLGRRSAGFALTPVFTQDDHPIPIVHHIVGESGELQVVRRDDAKKFVGDALRSPVDAAQGIVRCLRDVPHDVGVHRPQDGWDVASLKRLVQTLDKA